MFPQFYSPSSLWDSEWKKVLSSESCLEEQTPKPQNGKEEQAEGVRGQNLQDKQQELSLEPHLGEGGQDVWLCWPSPL